MFNSGLLNGSFICGGFSLFSACLSTRFEDVEGKILILVILNFKVHTVAEEESSHRLQSFSNKLLSAFVTSHTVIHHRHASISQVCKKFSMRGIFFSFVVVKTNLVKILQLL